MDCDGASLSSNVTARTTFSGFTQSTVATKKKHRSYASLDDSLVQVPGEEDPATYQMKHLNKKEQPGQCDLMLENSNRNHEFDFTVDWGQGFPELKEDSFYSLEVDATPVPLQLDVSSLIRHYNEQSSGATAGTTKARHDEQSFIKQQEKNKCNISSDRFVYHNRGGRCARNDRLSCHREAALEPSRKDTPTRNFYAK